MSNDPNYPRVIFIHQGTPARGAELFDALIDDVEALADVDGRLYELFDVRRGTMREMFGLRAWIRGLQAFSKGHFIGRKVGDPWTLPTTIAIANQHIVGEHRGAHAGDHPDVQALPALFERVS